MVNIHSTAIVSPKAELGNNVTVAPYAVIYEDTIIGDDTYIGPKTAVYPYTTIGKGNKINFSASIGHIPQDLKFKGEITKTIIGDNNVIHEYVTIQRGTAANWETVVGSNNFIMAYSHIAHDCIVKDNTTIANMVQLAGHVTIYSNAVIGGMSKVRQFCRVGKFCMIQGGRIVAKDVPHYILAGEMRVQFGGLNKIGLKRNGFTDEQINVIKTVYNYIYNSQFNVSQAKEQILAEFPDDVYANEIVEFINQSKGGII